jgi:HD-like signal output (HDOD) protein
MIARSPTGAALLVHLRAEVMHRSYPILGDTLRRIEYLTTHTSIADLASIILQDQGFTAIVLHAANKLNTGSRPIITITRAILIVGYNAIRDLAIAAEIADIAEKRLPKSIHLKHLLTRPCWQRITPTNSDLRRISRTVKKVLPEPYFIRSMS